MKKIVNTILHVVILTMLLSFTVQASVSDYEDKEEEIVLLSEDVKRTKDIEVGEERGSVVASASTEIINESRGNIGFIIQTLCYVECDQIKNIAILERLNESKNTWSEVARYEFTAKKEDFPSGLTALTNSMTIKNQKQGYYYRIRGIHNVKANGKILNYSSCTDGLLITEFGR